MKLADKIREKQLQENELAVCWLGQAGFLLKNSRGKTVVVDPYLSNCGERIRGFKRLSPELLSPEDLCPDYYVISHAHFDHLDFDTVPVVAANYPAARFLAPTSCEKPLLELGVSPERLIRLDRGMIYEDDTVKIHAVIADHGTAAPDAIGLVIEMDGHKFYFSGDTAYREDVFQQVKELAPDVAMVSVNGKYGNMTPLEGAKAVDFMGAKYAVPCHCWTFAEHSGDPGELCAWLLKNSTCVPFCFRQGEIGTISNTHNLLGEGVTSHESNPIYCA